MHPSFEDVLISLPSRASSLVLNALLDVIEDKLASKSKESLKRIKRAVGGGLKFFGPTEGQDQHRPHVAGAYGDSGSGGLIVKKETTVQKKEFPLLSLPSKVRFMIWSLLEDTDVLNLRQVCSEMKHEMDHKYGIPIILDTSTQSVYLMHQVAARSCQVVRMNLTDFNFFQKPEIMEHLNFNKDVPMTHEALDLVFRKFPNLLSITFFSKNVERCRPRHQENSETSLTFDVIGKKKNVYGVDVLYDPGRKIIKWTVDLRSPNQKLLCKPKFVQFEIPEDGTHIQDDALDFLEDQRDLFEIRADMPGIPWIEYKKSIEQNASSLGVLHLLNLDCSIGPLDLDVFGSCENLMLLNISGKEKNTSSTKLDNAGDPEPKYIEVTGVNNLIPLRKFTIMFLQRVRLPDKEFDCLKNDFQQHLTVRITQSVIGDTEVVSMNLGEGRDNWGDEDSHTHVALCLDCWQEEGNTPLESVCSISEFEEINTLSGKIIGAVMTAWVALC